MITSLPSVATHRTGPTFHLSAGTRVLVDASVVALAHRLAAGLVERGVVEVAPTVSVVGRDGPGSATPVVRLCLAADEPPESYRIEVTTRLDGVHDLTLTGGGASGLFYAVHTALQVLAAEGAVSGSITDQPAYSQRGVMLDCARKYFSPAWIKQLIVDMAERKLNYLQLHLSEGIGFRIESQRFPDLMSPEYLTRAEVAELIAFAREHHVQIVPDLDSPGHLEHILRDRPEFQLRLSTGDTHAGCLDYSNPAARAFMADLIDDIAGAFSGCTHFHLGGDEYFPAPWQEGDANSITADRAPQLLRYAHEVAGPGATLHDGYLHYLHELSDVLQRHGMTARVWNDDIDPRVDTVALRPGTEVDCWIRWNDSKAHAGHVAEAGMPVINANGDYLYFILTGEGLGTGPHKHPRGIFERWTPRTFMGAAGSAGDYLLPERYPLLGAHLSIWCDTPDALNEAEIATELADWMDAFAERVWGSPRGRESYEQFVERAKRAVPRP